MDIKKVMHATFLVAGTCIGGGMLALPTTVANNGLWMGSLILFISMIFMTLTALLILEANSWFREGTHMVTMTHSLLGEGAKWVSWITYTFIAYASLIAYIAAGAELCDHLLIRLFGIELTEFASHLTFTLLGGLFIAFGASVAAKINSAFFVLLVALYSSILIFGFQEVELSRLYYSHASKLHHAFPIFLAAFSFQMIIPTLRSYLESDYKALKTSIWLGTLLTMGVYFLWLFFIFGVIPREGEYGTIAALEGGNSIAKYLVESLQNSFLAAIISLFSLSAIITSFIGIALGLYDFLKDALQPSNFFQRPLLLIFILLPCFYFALTQERVFVTMLDLSGGLGDTILNGLIPVAMVTVGYYIQGKRSGCTLKWRPLNLVFSGIFALSILIFEIYRLIYLG